MILAKQPITLAEVKHIVDKLDEKEELKSYLKDFTKLSKEKADKLIKELESLNNQRLKQEDIVKIVDFVPKSIEELRTIVLDSSFSEEESNAILAITKNY